MSEGPTAADLARSANRVRQLVIRMLAAAGSGHTASSLGLADVMTVLYCKLLRLGPARPDWPDRDICVMSNGHCAPLLYAVMSERGFLPESELLTLRQFGSRLQGHPERILLPGLETTSGPLGCGVSQAAGMAYYIHYIQQATDRTVYCVVGDGELDEGNIWEAALFAAKYQLGQLVVIVDRNMIQIDGSTEEIMPLADIGQKWQSFGWHVQEIDGHAIEEIITAGQVARRMANQPSVIIAHTTPGKGVDFMEGDYHWHGSAPDQRQAEKALLQLQQKRSQEKHK